MLLVVLHGDGGQRDLRGIQRGSILQAAGLFGRGAARWRKQLTQCKEYLRVVKSYNINIIQSRDDTTDRNSAGKNQNANL